MNLNRTILTVEEFRALVDQSDALVELAKQHKINPWAAALAGVAFIRSEIARGADPAWWCMMLTVEDVLGAMLMPSSGGGDA